MLLKIFNRVNKRKNLVLLYLLGLILAIANALPAYIQSNFLGQIFSLSWVSIFFASANLITVFAIIFFPKLIKKIGNIASTEIILFLFIFSLLGMSLANHAIVIFIAFILLSVTSNLIWINMDILVESFSDDTSTGLTRTIYFTAINLGWIIAPSLSSYLIEIGDYYWVFIAAAICLVPFMAILIKNRHRLRDRGRYRTHPILPTMKKLWKKPNLRSIFFIALLLNLFFSSAVVYIPVYLHQNLGFDWSVLGIMFSIMLVPFIIFEIPAGWLADKYWGEKEIMGTGLAIIIIALFLFFAVREADPWLWGGLLFFSRVGASLVEAMRESYFFKIVSAKDVQYINFFRTTAPLGYLLGTILAIIIIYFYPLQYLFLFIALIMTSGFLFLHTIKDSK
ncbi:MAG: major facilitator superfamily transporter [Parcubacteria group bacterium ADurb.Bin115]|nr:MAG: major facilitator superfamily transporter [Parcubacteria group bacterium ADurb.Bin115]HQO10807.1 MFS transporter [bacterium]HQQ38144.1 MFS transporter [bacterium]